jgi:hypothetical protein
MARYRFCSFYFAADALWKTLDFPGESAILIAWCEASLKMRRIGRSPPGWAGILCFNIRTGGCILGNQTRMEYLNYSSVPFELYLALFGAAFIAIVGGGALLRWPFHRRETGGYLLAGGLGSLVGFIIATAPFIYVTAQHYLTRWFTGYYHSEWPPFWWPSWMPWVGPFYGFAIGSVFGFAGGCYVFYRRHRRLPQQT